MFNYFFRNFYQRNLIDNPPDFNRNAVHSIDNRCFFILGDCISAAVSDVFYAIVTVTAHAGHDGCNQFIGIMFSQ
jgi:hypothetical protein